MDRGDPEQERRIAELMRANAELAAEIRSLSGGRRTAPRSGRLPASRRLAELEAVKAKLEETAAELRAVREERDALLRHKAAQEREIARLRSGTLGLFRRARARFRM